MDKEELDLLEIVFTLAIGEWVFNDINDLQKLEDKIKAIDNLCKKQREVIDKAIEQINDYKIYCEENKGLSEYTDIEIEAIEPVISKLEDILKEVL